LINNAVVEPWLITQIKDGANVIVGFKDQVDWWNRNKLHLIEWGEKYDRMWYQKLGIPKQVAIDEYGLLD